MNITITDYKNKKSQQKKFRQIVSMYNEHRRSYERTHLRNGKTCHIASVDGVKGGVITESYGDGIFTMIHFAVFDEQDRGKGYLRACIKELQKHLNIVGVQVEFPQEKDFKIWGSFGFTNKSMLNFTEVLMNIKQDEFAMLNERAGGKSNGGKGIDVKDLMDVFSKI